jgi:ribonuclease HI
MYNYWFPLTQTHSCTNDIVIYVYVPGHAGIRCNEKADWLAGKATTPFGDLEPTAADIADAETRTPGRLKD